MSASAWPTAEAAIHAWVVAASGLAASHVIWGDKGPRPSPPYVSMWIDDTVGIGSDFRITDNAPDPVAGAELRVRTHGHRVATLQLQCFAGDDESDGAPLKRLGDVVSAIPLHSYELDLAGVGIGGVEPVRRVPGYRGGILEPRAVVDVQLHLGSMLEGRQTYVERMQITASPTDAAGDAMPELEHWNPDPPVET